MKTVVVGVYILGVLVLGSDFAAAKSLPMPSYLMACSRREPDLNACATKRGREAVEHIVKGDRKYKIPVLDPLLITKLHVDEGVLGLNFTATDLNIIGLRNTIVESIVWDAKNKKGVYNLKIPRLEIMSQYVISGRILVLPITGEGRANITLNNVTATYVFEFDLVKKPDGLTYVLPSRSHLTFDTSRMYIYLDNLFNGNQLLGVEMNKFMDENWRDMVKELGPVISNSIGEVMRRIQFNVFDLVDYENAFPDTPV